MLRGRRIFLVFSLLLAAGLLAGAVCCASACTGDAFMPPCHAHSHDATCSHPFLQAGLVQAPQFAAPLTAFVLVPARPEVHPRQATNASPAPLASPPEDSFRFAILRV